MRPQGRRQQAREYVERRLRFHEYDDKADILRGAQLDLDWAPSRSTFYGWVKDWENRRARDKSGYWSLANDNTGRPDLVMRVIAALVAASGGRGVRLTNAEAVWIARLGAALPDILALSTVTPSGEREPAGERRLYEEAARFVDAETADDEDRLAELESWAAVMYAADGAYFVAAMTSD